MPLLTRESLHARVDDAPLVFGSDGATGALRRYSSGANRPGHLEFSPLLVTPVYCNLHTGRSFCRPSLALPGVRRTTPLPPYSAPRDRTFPRTTITSVGDLARSRHPDASLVLEESARQDLNVILKARVYPLLTPNKV